MTTPSTPLRRRITVQANEIVEQYVRSGIEDVPARLQRRAKVLRGCEPLLAQELERRAGEAHIAHRERPQ